MAGVEGLGGNNSVGRQQAGALLARGLRHNASVRINAGGNAGIGVAQDPAIIFNSPHSRHVQVLAGSAMLAVPSVVGDVDEHLRAIDRELPDFLGENRFIADKNSYSLVAGGEDGARGSRAKIAYLTGQFIGKAENELVRNVFPKWDEM